MKKRKPKKARKPKPLMVTSWDSGKFTVVMDVIAAPSMLDYMKPRQARKLAAWLIRAADYLDAQ